MMQLDANFRDSLTLNLCKPYYSEKIWELWADVWENEQFQCAKNVAFCEENALT